MEQLIEQLKAQIIEALNFEDMTPADIDTDSPLFGEGLGLDSIDALELIMLMDREYGIKLADQRQVKPSSNPSVRWRNISKRIVPNENRCHRNRGGQCHRYHLCADLAVVVGRMVRHRQDVCAVQ